MKSVTSLVVLVMIVAACAAPQPPQGGQISQKDDENGGLLAGGSKHEEELKTQDKEEQHSLDGPDGPNDTLYILEPIIPRIPVHLITALLGKNTELSKTSKLIEQGQTDKLKNQDMVEKYSSTDPDDVDVTNTVKYNNYELDGEIGIPERTDLSPLEGIGIDEFYV